MIRLWVGAKNGVFSVEECYQSLSQAEDASLPV